MTIWIDKRVTLEKRRPRSFLAGVVHRKCCQSIASRILVLALSVVTISNGTIKVAQAETQGEGSARSHLSALPAGTHIHIAADQMRKTCFLASVDDVKLVCTKRKNLSGTNYTFARTEIRSVKLVRYRRSTLAGLGIGLAAGLGVGAIAGQLASPNTNSWFDLSVIAREVIIGIGGTVGLVAGGTIGAQPTCFAGRRYIRERCQSSERQQPLSAFIRFVIQRGDDHAEARNSAH